MTRRLAILLGVAAVACGIAALIIVLRDEGPARRSTLPLAPVGVDAGRQELVGLMTKGRASTYHAVYRSAGGQGLPQRLEVWRKDGLLRTDTETTDRGTVIRTASFDLRSGARACRREGEGPWSCRAADAPPTSEALVDQLTADLQRGSLEVSSATVAGRSVRCFSLGTTPPSRICMTSTGVLALLETGGASLELTALDEAVNDDSFTPPAT